VSATHECPCGCRAEIANRMFACKPGWFRLPRELRRAIWATAGRSLLNPARAGAVIDAISWYRDNPRKAA
jgi:hypothetical protein